jgi:hypothetical protein
MFLIRIAMTGLLLAGSMFADVTLRYKMTVKVNPTLPPQMTEPMTKAFGENVPPESVYQVKAGKGASSFGKLRAIVDFTGGRITLLDPEKKRAGTTTTQQLIAEMGKIMDTMPAEARAALASMKSNAEIKLTGRTETIQGIQAEEREATISVEAPSMPNAPAGPMFRMVMQFWTAKADEVMRVPALREVAAHNLWGYITMNPAGTLDQMFKQMPGGAEGIGKVAKEMQEAKSTMLRMNMRMWLPGIAAAIRQMPPDKNPFGDKFDPEAPLMELTQDLAEMSTASIPDSVFAVPEGYQEGTIAELVQAMMPKNPAAK